MSESATITRLNSALEGRYRIEREIGEGGMAEVYLARDERHDRSVALKVLKPELAAAVGAARFLAEIETTAKLQHPNWRVSADELSRRRAWLSQSGHTRRTRGTPRIATSRESGSPR